ncbi:MAG: tetratricopeptide repeat protein [Acidobacteriales bacterium]|nr:tetratricopeptide repeat protein [Candidatus Koribacter versatilis]MBI3644801.1 tetratricopeptide repeat protein [Terriglobales bacterium]
MKSNRFQIVLALFLTLWLGLAPAYGASKEIIQLQTQVEQLTQQMTLMQQQFNERMGVMKNLVEQNTDVANKVNAAIRDLQASITKQQQDRAGQVDQISGQIQALNDTMDELKVRLAKLSKQLEDMQSAQQSIAAQQAQAQQQAQAMAQAPPPDVLYNNALRDYNGGKPDLATQEFGDYIKFYPNTDLAGNAYFYLAELQFRAGNYQKAVEQYDLVLQSFPSGNKAAAAQLKKGFALLELGKEDEGTQELKHVIQRYPRTNEATQARERLRKAGAPRSH